MNKKIVSILFVICIVASTMVAVQPNMVTAKSTSDKNLSVIEITPTKNAPKSQALMFFAAGGITFHPLINTTPYMGATGNHCLQTSYSYVSFAAPINLPDGSIIKQLEFDYSNPIENPGATRASIERHYYSGIVEEVASVSASFSLPGSNFSLSPVITETVNNYYYDYAFIWGTSEPASQQQLCAMRVYYLPPKGFVTFLPVTTKEK